MKRALAVATVAIVMSATLFAKGRTVKITITGADIAQPIELSGPEVEQFGVWEGPGVSISGGPQVDGFIVNWRKGAVKAPGDRVKRYEVSFWVGCKLTESRCNTEEPQLAYVVSYAYDASTRQAYVYIPGRDDARFALNTRSIYRDGFQGHWFVPSTEWQQFVSPRIGR